MAESKTLITAVEWILRLVMGGIFVYAGIIKILAPDEFLIAVQSYHILPYSLAVATAFYLPWLELFCGLALWFRTAYRGSLSILIVLTIVFAVFIVSGWVRGLDIACGCFGTTDLSGANYLWLLTRDALFFLALTGLAVIEYFATQTNQR